MSDFKPDDFERIALLYAPELVSSMAISPDGRYLAIAAGDKLHIHSFTSAALSSAVGNTVIDLPRLVTLFMPAAVQSVVFSPDGKLITAAAEDKIHIYRMPE